MATRVRVPDWLESDEKSRSRRGTPRLSARSVLFLCATRDLGLFPPAPYKFSVSPQPPPTVSPTTSSADADSELVSFISLIHFATLLYLYQLSALPLRTTRPFDMSHKTSVPTHLVALPSVSASLSSLPQVKSMANVSIHTPSHLSAHAAESEAKVRSYQPLLFNLV